MVGKLVELLVYQRVEVMVVWMVVTRAAKRVGYSVDNLVFH